MDEETPTAPGQALSGDDMVVGTFASSKGPPMAKKRVISKSPKPKGKTDKDKNK